MSEHLPKQRPVSAHQIRKSNFSNRISRPKKKFASFGVIAANVALVVAAAFLVVLSTSGSNGSPKVERAAALGSSRAEEHANPIDKLSSADIAVHVARITKLDEATAVVNNADTAKAQLAIASTDDKLISKPQIMAEGLKSKKDIKSYKVQKGDTVPKIANKFGVTSETIRLSNGLDGDSVDPGTKLLISPINGIVYTVKQGDTPGGLAAEYRADKEQLIAFNDVELTGRLTVGEKIVIPDGVDPISDEFNYYSSSNPGGFYFGTRAEYGGNGYDYGWCTWHAANRRAEIGRPIPNNMGNAVSWLGIAQAAGLETGSEPREGAVVYHLNIGGWGHVAFVERVNGDGSIRVSDMNYPYWGQVTYRTVKPSEFGSYRFIY